MHGALPVSTKTAIGITLSLKRFARPSRAGMHTSTWWPARPCAGTPAESNRASSGRATPWAPSVHRYGTTAWLGAQRDPGAPERDTKGGAGDAAPDEALSSC